MKSSYLLLFSALSPQIVVLTRTLSMCHDAEKIACADVHTASYVLRGFVNKAAKHSKNDF
jgi:hypothetical protein